MRSKTEGVIGEILIESIFDRDISSTGIIGDLNEKNCRTYEKN